MTTISVKLIKRVHFLGGPFSWSTRWRLSFTTSISNKSAFKSIRILPPDVWFVYTLAKKHNSYKSRGIYLVTLPWYHQRNELVAWQMIFSLFHPQWLSFAAKKAYTNYVACTHTLSSHSKGTAHKKLIWFEKKNKQINLLTSSLEYFSIFRSTKIQMKGVCSTR